MKRVIDFMNGRFGKVVLKRPYRIIWRCISWSLVVIVVFKYVFVPLNEWWMNTVSFINHVVWG